MHYTHVELVKRITSWFITGVSLQSSERLFGLLILARNMSGL